MKNIIGLFDFPKDAEQAIKDLLSMSNISDSDISFVSQDTRGKVVDASGQESAIGEGVAAGATTGAVIGAVAGLAVANGVLPGLGSLFVAGPIASALGLTGAAATTVAGGMTGAAAGGLIGALGGLGVSREDATVYEKRVNEGSAIVGVNVPEGDEIAVKDVFARHGADEVRIYDKEE